MVWHHRCTSQVLWSPDRGQIHHHTRLLQYLPAQGLLKGLSNLQEASQGGVPASIKGREPSRKYITIH
jgi:hypothetical protein